MQLAVLLIPAMASNPLQVPCLCIRRIQGGLHDHAHLRSATSVFIRRGAYILIRQNYSIALQTGVRLSQDHTVAP